MISLTTAKLLLFVALCIGPKDKDLPSAHVIQVTSNNSYCVWTEKPGAWNLTGKVEASHDWPAGGDDISTHDLNSLTPKDRAIVQAIAHHNWSHDDVLVLANGDRVEKQGNTVFYTLNSGGANQQVYTLVTLQNGMPY